jgi:hypothetical protein
LACNPKAYAYELDLVRTLTKQMKGAAGRAPAAAHASASEDSSAAVVSSITARELIMAFNSIFTCTSGTAATGTTTFAASLRVCPCHSLHVNRCRQPHSTSNPAAQIAPAGSPHASRPLIAGLLPPGPPQPRPRPPGAVGWLGVGSMSTIPGLVGPPRQTHAHFATPRKLVTFSPDSEFHLQELAAVLASITLASLQLESILHSGSILEAPMSSGVVHLRFACVGCTTHGDGRGESTTTNRPRCTTRAAATSTSPCAGSRQSLLS